MLERFRSLQLVNRLLPSGSLRRDVTILSGASIVAQTIQLFAAPVLTRLYSPAAFGEWMLIMTFAGIGTAFGGGRYELGVTLARDNREAISVAYVQTIINVLTCLFAAGLFLAFSAYLGRILGSEVITRWSMVIPFIMFWTVFAANARFWFLRQKAFRHLALSRILLATSTVVAQLLAYPFCAGEASGLLLGSAIGVCSIVIILAIFLRTWGECDLFGQVSYRDVRDAFWRYRKFPLFTVPYGLVHEGRERGAVLTLGLFVSKSIVGYYGQIIRVFNLPTGLIATSINSVLIQRASASKNTHELERIVFKLLTILCVLGVPVFVFIAWHAEDLFAFVFGEQWREAGVYASALSLPGFSLLLAGSTDRLLDIRNRQNVAFFLEFLYSTAALGTILYFCAIRNNAYVGIVVFAAICFVGHISRVCGVYYCWNFSWRPLLRLAAATTLLACMFSLVFLATTRLNYFSRGWAVVIAIGFCIVYYSVAGFVWYRSMANTRREIAEGST